MSDTFKPYPAKRYGPKGQTRYINSAAEEAAGWTDSPKTAGQAPKESKEQKPKE